MSATLRRLRLLHDRRRGDPGRRARPHRARASRSRTSTRRRPSTRWCSRVDHHENAAASAAADPASIGHLVALADEVAKASGNADYRLIANTGAGAGQTVFHTHLHVLGGSSRMTESLI